MLCEQLHRVVRPLQEDVRSYLRSGVAITSLTQCVEELVLNSLDAGSTSITVRIDIPNFRVQVSDNGSGIAFEDLNRVGGRYMSSKCHDLKDLQNLNFYGFRGEALASIREICDVLEVTTRHVSSYQTYCKLFRNLQVLELAKSTFPRANSGTTVTIHNVFANLPVRRKMITETYDFDRVRHRIASIALIHPKTAFLLINDSTGAKCVQTHVCKSTISTFSQLFGKSRSKGLQQVNCAHKNFKVSGLISTEVHHSKSLQFLFVNHRLLLKTKIHKFMNILLEKSELIRKQLPFDIPEATSDKYQNKVVSPQNSKSNEKHGIFVLNISCPLMDYDICLDPAKTLIEFQDWDDVLFCIQRCVEEFLSKNNLILHHQHSPKGPGSGGEDNDGLSEGSLHPSLDAFAYKREIETGDVKRSLHSSTVFRQTRTGKVDGASLKKTFGQKEHSLLSHGKLKDSLVAGKNVQNGTTGYCSSLGVYMDQSLGSSKSVPKDKSSPSLQKSAFCVDIENVEKPPSCSFGNESGSFVTNHKNVGRTGSSINTSAYKTVLVSDSFLRASGKCSPKLSGSSKDLVPATTMSSGLIPSDSEIGASLTHKGLSNQSNTGCSGCRNISKSKSTAVIAFTSPCPITLKSGYARKRSQVNKESSANCEVASKNRKLISLKGSGKRQNWSNRIYVDNGEDNVEDSVCSVASYDQAKKKSDGSDCTIQQSTTHDSSKENIRINNVDFSPVPHWYTDDMTVPVPCNEECTNDLIDNAHRLDCHKQESPNKEIVKSGAVTGNTEQGQTRPEKEDVPVNGSGETCRNQSKRSSFVPNSMPEVPAEEKIMDKHESKCRIDNNWHCAFDASTGRNLFVNVRTGHSSFEHPSRLDTLGNDIAIVNGAEDDKEENNGHLNVPHPVASHLSFSCTPWLPRQDRRQQSSAYDNDNNSVCFKGDSHLATLYQEHQDRQETEEKLCKWANADELKAYEQNLCNSTGKTVAEMLDNWTNPVFGASEKDILMMNKPGRCVKDQISIHNVVHPYRFTRDMLAGMKVLRQLDDKFIVGVISSEGKGDDLLVLVDQHAAHERVRLEQLQSELFEDSSSARRPQIKSSSVSPPIEISLFIEEVRLLRTFRSEIERTGIQFAISGGVEDSDEVSVLIHGVPSVFVEREVSEVKRGRPSVAVSKVKELIREHLGQILTMRGVPALIPKVIFQVMKSLACHGAVKFGEPLGLDECRELVLNLSKCQLPFQCAHGRPSVIPLADLRLLQRKMLSQEIESPPRMNKLHCLSNKDVKVTK
ncbi:DNA mismatch repair protein Mlh3-like [Montipora foliosa]|uniref:DNA mismatch repair protein Mlh3-like n=1 Tax=Montipora foliosa TaxID=591990 RepID=UPI0035F18386